MRTITTIDVIEDLIERERGVERVQVNAATERVTVDYTPGLTSPEELAHAMEEAGYEAAPFDPDEELSDRGIAFVNASRLRGFRLPQGPPSDEPATLQRPV